MNKNIKAIVFDLGNVLIDIKWDMCLKKLKPYDDNIENKFKTFFKENDELFKSLEMGKISDQNFIETVKKHTKLDFDFLTFAKIISEIFEEKKIITDQLPKLKKHYKLYMLSNTSSLHHLYGWKDYDFLKYFDRMFLSYQIGYLKPMPEIYEYVENQIELKTSEFIYFDDIEQYVEGAKNRNWNAFQLKNEEVFFQTLKNYGINI